MTRGLMSLLGLGVAIIVVLLPSLVLSQATPAGAESYETKEMSKEIVELRNQLKEMQKRQEEQIAQMQKRQEEQMAQMQRRIEELEKASKVNKETEEQITATSDTGSAPSLRQTTPTTTEEDEWWKKIKVGYDRGFFLKTDNFELKTNLRLQFRIDSQDKFTIERSRLLFSGFAYYPWLRFENQITLEGESVSLRDFYVDNARHTRVFPRLGQYKVPFNREFLTSSAVLQLVTRSIVSDEFSMGRDIGGSVYGLLGDYVIYGGGIFNGNGTNEIGQDDDMFYVGRVQFTPLGGNLKYSSSAWPVTGDYKYVEGAFGTPKEPLLAISAAVGWLPGLEPAKETTDGQESGRCEDLGAAKCDVFQFSADLAFKYNIFSFEGEYNLRNIAPDEDGIASVLSNGFRVQAGFFIIPDTLEVAGRFAFIDLDDDASDDRMWEITPGVSWYISKSPKLKAQLNYSFIEEEGSGDNVFRAQLQYDF